MNNEVKIKEIGFIDLVDLVVKNFVPFLIIFLLGIFLSYLISIKYYNEVHTIKLPYSISESASKRLANVDVVLKDNIFNYRNVENDIPDNFSITEKYLKLVLSDQKQSTTELKDLIYKISTLFDRNLENMIFISLQKEIDVTSNKINELIDIEKLRIQYAIEKAELRKKELTNEITSNLQGIHNSLILQLKIAKELGWVLPNYQLLNVKVLENKSYITDIFNIDNSENTTVNYFYGSEIIEKEIKMVEILLEQILDHHEINLINTEIKNYKYILDNGLYQIYDKSDEILKQQEFLLSLNALQKNDQYKNSLILNKDSIIIETKNNLKIILLLPILFCGIFYLFLLYRLIKH